MPHITNGTIVKTNTKGKAEAIEARVVTGLIHVSQAHAIIVVPVTHPKMQGTHKECFHWHKQGHFSQFCCSKQCGKYPGSNVKSSSQNKYLHCDVHEID